MTNYQRSAINTVADVVAVADHAGSFYFSPDTMRAFKSRVQARGFFAVDGAESLPGRRYVFVTSERFGDDAPRVYSVRMMTLGTVRDDRPAVDIVTVPTTPDIDRWSSLALAVSAASAYVAYLRTGADA